jgi:acid phosphatase type 7
VAPIPVVLSAQRIGGALEAMRYCGSKRGCRSSSTRLGRLVTLGGLLSILLTLALSAPAFGADPTIAAVGDMACPPTDPSYNSGNGTSTKCRQRYVSDLVVAAAPAALLDLGDNQYDFGELANFQAVYHPTFGRANAVVYPSLGNAEYDTVDARGFFDYFSSVGVTSRITASSIDASHWANGYYSFDVGTWHMIALNSNCAEGTVGGCSSGRTQEVWLRNDLAAHPNRCTLAYWHHPRWNSGSLGNDSSTSQFWTDLYNAHADVVLNGHGNHHYERFVPQDPAGNPTSTGIREFIVSTGGQEHGTPPGTPGDPNTSQVRDYTSFGILKLTLHPASYDWQFVPEVGGSFTDSGSGACDASAATVPAAPALSATAGDGTVHLSWTAPSDGGAAITGYKVYRGTSSGGETLLKTVGNVTSTDDATAANGTKYWYRVSAVNSVGEGPQSNEASATPAPPSPFPSTPVLDSFARSAGSLGTGWQSPALQDGGTVSIASSGLTRSSAGAASATYSAAQFGADQEAYLTVPTLPSGGDFMQLAGRVSTLSSSTVSCYFLRVTPSLGTWELRQKLNGSGSTLLTSFSSPLVAGDSIGIRIAGSAITAYRKPGSGSWTAVGSTSSTSITAGGYISFTLGDTAMRGGAFGGGAVTSAQAPAAPALAATPGDASVHLTWSAPPDGGSAITGYKVYRGTSAGGETLLKSVGNVTSTDDATAGNGTSYWYRVTAVNGVGEGSQSNEVSATPVPAISVTDVSHPEGNAGQTDYAFTISLSSASASSATVSYRTQDGTATTADSDYAGLASSTLTFSAGETSKTVTVEGTGDGTFEPDEGFSLKLSSPSGATVADDTGAGAILNDDSQPQLSIDDVTHPEGDAGQTDYAFTVSLTNPSSQQVQVGADTLDGTATTAGSDYASLGATTLTFAPARPPRP